MAEKSQGQLMFENLSYSKKNIFEEASSEKIKEIYEKEETLTLFRATFMKVFVSLEDRVAIINAEGTPDEVAARVFEAVKPLL